MTAQIAAIIALPAVAAGILARLVLLRQPRRRGYADLALAAAVGLLAYADWRRDPLAAGFTAVVGVALVGTGIHALATRPAATRRKEN